MPNGHTPHFKLSAFEGPLDLLLQLIEDSKLQINEIALAEVTEQFLSHLRSLEKIHPELLAEFLTVAAKLLVIKSRALIPSLEVTEEAEEETDLTAQLLQLKKYREASKALKTIEALQRQSFAREAFTNQQVVFFPDPETTPESLQKAALGLTKQLQELAKLPDHTVTEVISISEKISLLQQELSTRVEVALHDLLKTSKSKTEVIVTFLALLELIKQKILTVEQEEMFANIVIKKNTDHGITES